MNRGAAIRGAVVAAAAMAAGFLVGAGAQAADQPAAAVLAEAAAAALAAAVGGYAALLGTARAMGDVMAAADRMAAGELGERAAAYGGSAVRLTASFNSVARQLEERLTEARAERARVEAVFNASTDGMVALAGDTTIQFLNSAAAMMLGAEGGSALGRPLIEAARDYELDALVRQAGAADEPSTSVITFGPQRLPLRAAAIPIADGAGWDILLMLTDLTEVSRVDQVRRDFLGNVSHELRTPLAAVSALAETLESGAVDPGPETAEFVGRIRQQVDRMSALVNELLDLSRIESGATALEPEPLDLASLVAESASLLRQRAESEDVRIHVPAEPGPTVEADRASLLRALNNLLDNAIKFSPAGGTVSVECSVEGDLAVVRVRDEGPGIPPQDLPRVFERFYKGDASRAGSGVGLGLAIVKHVVRAHDGTVEATSEPGRGATFVIRIPRQFVSARTPARHDVRG